MLVRLAVLAFVLALAPAGAAPSAHYVPHVGDTFTFEETTTVTGGYGNYSGYTETDTAVGTVNVTAVLSNCTETAKYDYSGHYLNNAGSDYDWNEVGTFTFSAVTFDYVTGTDNQTGDNGSGVWFYLNNSLSVGSTFSQLGTGMTVKSLDTSYALNTALGTNVKTIYADGAGTYERDDGYGVFSAAYNWRAYFDPGTGYIVGYHYAELDSDGHGDGFVYTDTLDVTKTSYALTPAAAPPLYTVTFSQAGLGAGTPWTVTFDGVPQTGTGSSIYVTGVANGTYLYGFSAPGYSASPGLGWVTVAGATGVPPVTFAANPSGGPSVAAWLVYLLVALVVVVIVVAIAVAAARRARRGPPLPRHSYGGQPHYGPPPPGPAPPPISLRPADQPQIQQVVVKEVVKVNCRYCGSLIDSTAEKCPFCGATRT
jgi:hypothetical protein